MRATPLARDTLPPQLRKICHRLGKPAEAELGFVTSDKAKHFILNLPDEPPQPFAALFPDVDAHALALLDQMLQFNPARRISVEAALAHPFMAPLHVESDEPEAAFTCSFDFEHQDLSKATLQQLIWDEVPGAARLPAMRSSERQNRHAFTCQGPQHHKAPLQRLWTRCNGCLSRCCSNSGPENLRSK